MTLTTRAGRVRAGWLAVALVMFAVGWGANQFSPMLIVYRHALGLGAGAIAGLFAPYAMDGLTAVLGRPGAFALVAGLAGALAWSARRRGPRAPRRRRPSKAPARQHTERLPLAPAGLPGPLALGRDRPLGRRQPALDRVDDRRA